MWLVVSITNISPHTWIAGWDNFSVSFDLPLNLSRTFWATWREYRGLGVMTDSEVVDIWRQVILFALSLFTPQPLVEQLYYLAMVLVGAIGMALLSQDVFVALFPHRRKSSVTQAVGYLGGLSYLFSVFTIATFYLPIAMYVVRYAFFPLVVAFFLRTVHDRPLFRTRSVRWLVVISLLGSPSYLTATVFFTLLIILGLSIVSSVKHLKAYFLTLGLFVLLNSFWLLPFGLYVQHKSPLVPLASTFVEVNQIQLNQPGMAFYWSALWQLLPSFATTTFTTLPDVQTKLLHPFFEGLANNRAYHFYLTVLWSGVVVGMAVMGRRLWQRRLAGVWILLLFLVSSFFLRKEYPPLGFLYDWLGTTVPLLKIILRFGGEKFYPLLMLSISVLSSVGLVSGGLWIGQRWTQRVKMPASWRHWSAILSLLAVSVVFIVPFTFFFQGQFFSSVVRTSIPDQYDQVVEIINADDRTGRVVHLPFDPNSYWKSYSWGYVGSAFLNFSLNKPLLDRTFEPASLENDYLNQTIGQLLQNAPRLTEPELEQRARRLAHLLTMVQARYVLVDDSVTPLVYAKSGRFFGDYSSSEAKTVLAKMAELGLIQVRFEDRIDLAEYVPAELLATVPAGEHRPQLLLYELPVSTEIFTSPDQAFNLDTQLGNAFITPVLDKDQLVIQTSQLPQRTYPFFQPNKQVTTQGREMAINQPFEFGTNVSSGFDPLTPVSSRLYQVYSVTTDQGVDIKLREVMQPFVTATGQSDIRRDLTVSFDAALFNASYSAEVSTTDVASNWHALGEATLSPYRLGVAHVVLPVILGPPETEVYLGSVLVEVNLPTITLLSPTEPKTLTPTAFLLTNDENCYQDKGAAYDHSLRYERGVAELTSKDGTTCMTTFLLNQLPAIPTYFEVKLPFSLTETALEEHQTLNTPSSWQKQVEAEIHDLPTASYATACILDESGSGCLNNHQVLSARNAPETVLTTEMLSGSPSTQLLITLSALNNSTQQLRLQTMTVYPYQAVQQVPVALPPVATEPQTQIVAAGSTLLTRIPLSLSPNSFLMNTAKDGFQLFTGPCAQSTGTKTAKRLSMGTLSYVQNCLQGLYQSVHIPAVFFSLWTSEYNVLSGKFPQFSLAGNDVQYKTEYTSRFTGMLDTAPFKQLQVADPLGLPGSFKPAIQDVLTNLTYQPTHTTIFPQAVTQQSSRPLYSLIQNSENQGIMAVKDMNILTLPTHWTNWYVQNGNPEVSLTPLNVLNTERILPSIWKVQVKVPEEVTTDYALLVFNQGFDEQWSLLETDSLLGAWLGWGSTTATQVRVQGWSNGWLLEKEALLPDTEMTFYAFYTPERWAIVGWLVTISVTAGVVVWVLRRPRQSNSRSHALRQRIKKRLRAR